MNIREFRILPPFLIFFSVDFVLFCCILDLFAIIIIFLKVDLGLGHFRCFSYAFFLIFLGLFVFFFRGVSFGVYSRMGIRAHEILY